MFLGQTVRTPYGLGIISALRDTDAVVIPTQWLMAGGQKPTFYLNNNDVKAFYPVGCNVKCTFGSGNVTAIRPDGIYVVTLTNWKLADGKSPTLYLNEAALSFNIPVAPTKKEKTDNQRWFEKANTAKAEAAEFFKSGDMESARGKYLESVDALQYLGEDLTNDEKARVFEQSVLCNNNIALCCLRLKNFLESAQFGRNALLLIHTLEERIPQGAMVWQSLVSQGMTMEKYQKEWKKKSFFLVGKAELGLNNFQKALDNLKAALVLIQGDAALAKQSDELRGLINTAQTKLTAEKKKEKATWSKAFEKGKKEEMYSDPPSPPPSQAAAAPSAANGAAAKKSVAAAVSDIDVDKIIKAATGGDKAGKAPAASAASGGELWKPDSVSIALVMGSFFLAVGGWVWWSFSRRRYF